MHIDVFPVLLAALAAVIYYLHNKAVELRPANPINAKFYTCLNCILVAVWVLLLTLHLD